MTREIRTTQIEEKKYNICDHLLNEMHNIIFHFRKLLIGYCITYVFIYVRLVRIFMGKKNDFYKKISRNVFMFIACVFSTNLA